MSPSPPRLWLLRHAQPKGMSGLCYGASDVQVPAEATQQAAVRFVQQAQPAAVAQVLTSPSSRTQALAQALHYRWGLPAPVCDGRLREFNFGCWEGVAWSQIPKPALDAWVADFADHRFGGGDSCRRLVMEVAQLWRELQAAGSAGDVVWVTHAGVIRALNWLLGSAREQPDFRLDAKDWPASAPGFGEWQCLALPARPSQAGLIRR